MERFDEIAAALNRIEHDNGVRILYACESGSRAWGFASPDSDFDVRFIYLSPRDWYLSVNLERKRDVIEVPIDDSLDISGWDLRKALGLLRKSNPPLMEWLGSPIVYIDRYDTASSLTDLFPEYFSPISCGYHYLSMAKKNYRGYLKPGKVRLKKYFYVLRPLLAVQWIEKELGVVPTEFESLLTTLVQDRELIEIIRDLLKRKSRALESEYADAIPVLNAYLENEIARLEGSQFSKKDKQADPENLDRYFRAKLVEVWADA